MVEHEKKISSPGFKGVVILVCVYIGFRLLFYSFPGLKSLFFIRPVGSLISLFWGVGVFNGNEWVYETGGIKIILGELCSGTTFFCLLSAYVIMKYSSGGLSAWWIAACYPLSLVTNASRVLCSVYVSGYTMNQFSESTHSQIHLFVGVIVFSITTCLSWLRTLSISINLLRNPSRPWKRSSP